MKKKKWKKEKKKIRERMKRTGQGRMEAENKN